MAESSVHELILELKLVTGRFRQALGMSGTSLQKFEQQLKETEKTARTFKSLAISGAVFSGIGFGIAEGLKAMIEPAVDFQKAQADLQVATGASTEQLERFSRQAHDLSGTLPETAEEVTKAQIALARMLGTSQAAMQTTAVATQFAAATNMTAADAAGLLGSAYQTLGDKSKPLRQGFQQIADTLTVLTTRFPHSATSGDELARSFAHAALTARTYGLSLQQLGGLMGVATQSGMGGGRGVGTYVEELVNAMGKLKGGFPTMNNFMPGAYATNAQHGMDLLATVGRMRSMPIANLKAYEKSLGTEGMLLQYLIDHYDQLKGATAQFGAVAGATGKAATAAADTPAGRLKVFQDNLENLKEAIGTDLLPALLAIVRGMAPVLRAFTHFAENHKYIVMIGGALAALAAGVLLTIGPMLMAIAVIKEMTEWFSLAEAAGKVLEGVLWAINLVMDANPIALVVLGAVALAAVGYEVWKHWSAVKDLFEGAYQWGVHLVDNLVKGIEAGLGKIHQAMKHVTKTIRSYLPFSPAETGPLRDLERVRIVQTIAESLRPGPLLNAMRGVALAVATVPVMAMPIASPAMAGGSGSGAPIAVHIHIDGSAQDSPLAAQVLAHKDEIARAAVEAMRKAQRNYDRTRF